MSFRGVPLSSAPLHHLFGTAVLTPLLTPTFLTSSKQSSTSTQLECPTASQRRNVAHIIDSNALYHERQSLTRGHQTPMSSHLGTHGSAPLSTTPPQPDNPMSLSDLEAVTEHQPLRCRLLHSPDGDLSAMRLQSATKELSASLGKVRGGARTAKVSTWEREQARPSAPTK